MRIAVDLHIHSALSPCACDDMTPNNIVNMAYIKKLDAIAVTDHNSVKNLEAVIDCADKKGIIVVPALELETKEEIHLLCYFRTLESAKVFELFIEDRAANIKNNSSVFGNQIAYNSSDVQVEEIDRLLLAAVDIGIDDAVSEVRRLGGAVVPAHIDRQSYSILNTLGIIPKYLNFKYMEVSGNCCDSQLSDIKRKFDYNNHYKYISYSDAHNLADILERSQYLEIGGRNKSVNTIVDLFS